MSVLLLKRKESTDIFDVVKKFPANQDLLETYDGVGHSSGSALHH